MGVKEKWNWCNNYLSEEGSHIYPIFSPAYISYSSSSRNQHDCKHQIESLSQVATDKLLLPSSVIPMCEPVAKQFVVAASLAQCGDVESNPGPKREPKPDKAKIMADKVDSHDAKLEELENLVKGQASLIDELKSKQVELTSALESKQVQLESALNDSKVQAAKELSDVKTSQEEALKEVKNDIGGIKQRLGGLDALGSQSSDTSGKVQELQDALDDITEKLWELDKSWKNNLVFYGIKMDSGTDEHPSITEQKIRDVIFKHLRISRDVSILRTKRSSNGPEVRGCKPVTVYFEKWQDKDEILRKSSMLRGANIYISEDFSKRVRDQRLELQKFMKLMRQRRPNSNFSLQYDKLIIDHEIYMFNDMTGRVEEVGGNRSLSPGPGMPENYNYVPNERGSANLERMRKRSNERKNRKKQTQSADRTVPRLQKSYSTESSLHHMVPNSPVHPEPNRVEDLDSESDSRQNSPVKTVKHASPRVNGSNGLHASPTKQPKMPQVKEEQEEETKVNGNMANGHGPTTTVANGDPPPAAINGEARIIKASEDNHVGEHVPMVVSAAE